MPVLKYFLKIAEITQTTLFVHMLFCPPDTESVFQVKQRFTLEERTRLSMQR